MNLERLSTRMLVICGGVSAILISRGMSQPGGGTPSRQVTLHVHVADEAGAPIADLWTSAGVVGQYASASHDTNAEGVASLVLTVSNTAATARIIAFSLASGPPGHEADAQRYNQLISQYSFPGWTFVSILPDVASYDVELVGHPAVRATATLKRSNGSPAAAEVYVKGRPDVFVTAPDGSVTALGVRRATSNDLLVCWLDTDLVTTIPISAASAQQDVALGNVRAPSLVADATIKIAVSHWKDVTVASGFRIGATLVAADGSAVFEYERGSNDSVGRQDDRRAPPRVPAGTYYACTGTVTRGPGIQLLNLVRGGHSAELDAAGIPKVTVTAGQEVTISVDAVQVCAAMLGLGATD